MIKFCVPPGIGDFSAMYAVLCNVPRDIGIISSYDNPNRLGYFLDILPKVTNLGYGQFNCDFPVHLTLPPHTDLMMIPDEEYYLSVNHWLESGGKIADWMPYPVNYHYDFNINDEMKQAAKDALVGLENVPKIGIYSTAYGNSRHWGFWGPDEWYRLIRGICKLVPPETTFVFIGAEYDLGISEVVQSACLRDNIPVRWTVGQLHIGSVVELIRELDYFFVFPSGLGFIADVVRTPHVMWFPPNLDLMRYTFTDPESYGTSHHLFTSPEDAVEEFNNHAKKIFLERCSIDA